MSSLVPVGFNDIASSLTTSYSVVVYENVGYSGRSTAFHWNIANLATQNYGLYGGETWNDRISSYW